MRFSAILWLLFLFNKTTAQVQTFKVAGTVIDKSTGEPLPGVFVHSHESHLVSYTDSLGRFLFAAFPQGTHHLHAELTGYAGFAEYFNIKSDTVSVVISLQESTIELRSLVVESEVSLSAYKSQSQDLIVLSKEDLKDGNAMTLSQKLTRLPGVNQQQTGASISRPVIRGLQGNRILVSDLGMKQEGQQWGTDHGLEIDAFGAEKVEIVKGPATLLYGSDALGGVIRIQTPSIPLPGIRGEWQSLIRTNNDYRGSSFSLESLKGKWFIKARGTWAEFGDYRIPARSFTYLNRTLPISGERLRNTSGKELHYQSTFGFVSEKMTLKWTWSHFHQKNGLFPGIVGIPTPASVRDDGDTRDIDLPQQVVDHKKMAFNGIFNLEKGQLKVDGGWQQNERQELIRPHRNGFSPLPNNSLAHRLILSTWQVSARYHLHRKGNWKWIPGINASLQRNTRDGWEYLLPNHHSADLGIFIYSEYHVTDQLTWSGGGRLDYGERHAFSFSTPIYSSENVISGYSLRTPQVDRTFFNWSASTGLSYSPSQYWNFKANLARSFRIPNAAELLINGVHHGTFRHEMGDANLNSEIGYQADVSVLYEAEHIYLKLTPYLNFFQGYIYLRPSARFSELPDGGQVYIYSQHDALFTGTELYTEWHPIEPIHLEWTLDGLYSYNLTTSLSLPFTPPIRNRLQVSYELETNKIRIPNWSVGGAWLIWANQMNVDRNELTTPGAGVVELFASMSFRVARQHCALKLGIQNVFNRYYMSHLSAYRALQLPEQGRNFSVYLNIPFGIKTKNSN